MAGTNPFDPAAPGLNAQGYADSSGNMAATFDPARDGVDNATTPVTATPYAAPLEAIAPTITARIDATQTSGESWLEALSRLLPTIATTYQQGQLIKVQTDRAKAGLPPLDMSQYGLGVKVGLADDTKQYLLLAGLLVGGAVLLHRFAK